MSVLYCINQPVSKISTFNGGSELIVRSPTWCQNFLIKSLNCVYIEMKLNMNEFKITNFITITQP